MTISSPNTPETPDPTTAPRRRGRGPDLALVEETAVWLEVNGEPAVTWMCTPAMLEELAVGWLHGEGYIRTRRDLRSLRPCASDLGFWAEVDEERVRAVRAEGRTPVLASGCGAVSVFLADPATAPAGTRRGDPPDGGSLRGQFKALFASGTRYQETGGIHAAALSTGADLLYHAEDIGRHNAVDKVIGAAMLDDRNMSGLGLLVTGRISAELAFKAARSDVAWIATPSVPSTMAVAVAGRSGMTLVGRAVSATPQVHRPS
ncbi:MAG: formate dehydrogenase accessory sulfurtransferase FdhD [Gemmatimonadota bacterium]|nr:formate dehydrogenase accessory sulfurtransferase FdhD [Gemmatimonadota bacterium]MDH5196462.1 formate dehydrogenase accessory sulfurtransferase FdhD [Gemmatimonadota bacterium]